MYLVPFVQFFEEQGIAETRTITIRLHDALPDDEYGLVEAYCVDPGCDCRRVMLNVMARRQKKQLATISFAFDRSGEMAGPFLDPLNPQSRYAEDLMALVVKVALTDRHYVARLESHYYQVKRAVADPNHPVHEILSQTGIGGKYGRRKKIKRRGKLSRSSLKHKRPV